MHSHPDAGRQPSLCGRCNPDRSRVPPGETGVRFRNSQLRRACTLRKLCQPASLLQISGPSRKPRSTSDSASLRGGNTALSSNGASGNPGAVQIGYRVLSIKNDGRAQESQSAPLPRENSLVVTPLSAAGVDVSCHRPYTATYDELAARRITVDNPRRFFGRSLQR